MTVNLGSAFGKIILDATGIIDGVSRANGALGKLEAGVSMASKALVTGLGAGAVALGGLAVKSGQAAADMESAMSGIAATMNKTKDEVAPLGDLIKDLAVNPNLKVSATEAADAVAMLARNGLDMTQILDGAAEATVFLANATGGTFSQSADIMTDAMAIFGIEASNAIDAVNGITSVTTNSKFSIDDYALALAQGGGAAKAAGVEFGDFNTAIAAISPLFGSGSDAGTSFKVMMQRLVPASSTAADAMRELGIVTADGANQFFDADGNLRSMAEIVGVLESAFGGLTEQQRNQALSTIFGTDAMRAAVGLMDTGRVSFEQLAATMAQTDAMDAAATRMDNFRGVMEIVKSLFEGFMLQIGEVLLPLMRQMADQLLIIAEQVGPLVVLFFTQLVTLLTTGAAPLGTFRNLIVFLAESLGMTAVQAESLANGISSAITFIGDAVASFVSWQDVLIAVGIIVASIVVPALFSLLATVATIAAPILAVIAVVALLRTAWEQDWGGIQEKTQAVIDFVVPLVTNAIAAIKEWWAQNGDEILAKASEIWEAVKSAVETAVGIVKTTVDSALKAIYGWWEDHGAAVMTIVNALWENAKEQFNANLELLRLAVTGVLDGIKQFWEDHGETIKTIVETLWELIKQTFETGKEVITGIIEALAALINEDWETLKEELLGIAEAIWEEIEAVFTAAITIIETVVGDIIKTITNPFETFEWGSVGEAVVDGITNGISSTAGKIATAAVEAATAAWEAAKAFLGISSPSKLFYDLWAWVPEGAANALVDGTASLVRAMAGMGDAAFDTAADSVGKLANAVSGLDPVLALIEKLRGFDTGDGVEGVFLWLNHQLLKMAEAIRAGAVAFGGMVEETEAYAKLLGAAVKALTDGAEAVSLIREVDTSTSIEPIVLWLNHQVLVMAQAVRAGAVAFGGLMEETEAYAKLAKEVIGVFAEGVGAVASIQEFVPIADIQQKVGDFAAQLVIVFSALSIALHEAGQQLGEALQNAASMSDFVIDIVKMIKPAVDGIVAILGFVQIPGIQDFARSFARDVVAVMTEIVKAFSEATGLSAEGLAKAADMASNITAIAKMVDPLTDGEKGAFVEMMGWVRRGAVDLPEIARQFSADLISVTTEIVNALTTSSLATGLALDKAGRMAENIKELFIAVKKAVIAMKEIPKVEDLALTQQNVRDFSALFLDVAVEIVTTVAELVAIVGEGGIALTERAANSFGTIANSMMGIVNSLSSMSSSEIDTAAIFQLLDQLPKIAMRIARIMSMVDMTQVSDLFIEWLQSFSEINESLAASFDSLVKISQIELDPAPIFKNLGVLPFVAQRIADTLNLITSTASNPQGAVAWIKNAVDSTLAIIKKLQDLVQADVPGGIGDIIAAINAQMSILPVTFADVAAQAVNALVSTLQAGVPIISGLAAQIGQMVSSDIAAGIFANQAIVANAAQVVVQAAIPAPVVNVNVPGGGGSTTTNFYGGQQFGGASAVTDPLAALRKIA